MMEGKQEWKQLMYTYHLALAKNRPATIGIDFIQAKKRIAMYSELEKRGMTVFYENATVKALMRKAIPDTQGLTDAEIEQMPPFVRQLKCGGAIENGQPGCFTSKYNKTECARRKGMVQWHPGWYADYASEVEFLPFSHADTDTLIHFEFAFFDR